MKKESVMSEKYSKEWYHEQGQRDGAKNESYNSPRPNALAELTMPESVSKDLNEKGDAYDAGWKNGYKQR